MPGAVSVPAGTVRVLFMTAAVPAVVMAAGLLLLRTVTLVAVLLRIGASITLYPAGSYPALLKTLPTRALTFAPVSSANVMVVDVAVAFAGAPWPNSTV